MSNADLPHSSPPAAGPARRYPRPPRLAWLCALLVVVALAAALTVPWGIVRVLTRGPSATGSASSPASASGLGDPYYPDAGAPGYDATRYSIALTWDPGTQSLTAVTTISARATETLRTVSFDLALHTDHVWVDGRPATFTKQGFADVVVTPAQPIRGGQDFTVTVDYSGRPSAVREGTFTPSVSTPQEWTVAGEPESSAWWFPANDHPSDPALMDISIRVPAGLQAISIGHLVSRDVGGERDFDTWHWVSREPTATFLAFVSVGHFDIGQGVSDAVPYVYTVSRQLPAAQRRRAMAALLTTGAKVRVLESMFGPYPFSDLGGFVPARPLGFAGLETQTRPVYAARALTDPRFSPDLLSHELAHMWFGDHVTVRQWNDIFDSEGYASWAWWGYQERTGGPSANAELDRTYDQLRDKPRFWRITMIDPGRDHLFDAVYARGPMALQALRNVIGDQAFFRLARDWGQQAGSRSLEEWMAKAQSETPIDLGPFFRAWIYSPTAPARTAANGFRR